MDAPFNLADYVGSDDRIAVFFDGEDKPTRMHPIDVKAIIARGAKVLLGPAKPSQEPQTEPVHAAPESVGVDGSLPFDFSAFSLADLKGLYADALDQGHSMPEPKGKSKEAFYIEALTQAGFVPDSEQ